MTFYDNNLLANYKYICIIFQIPINNTYSNSNNNNKTYSQSG